MSLLVDLQVVPNRIFETVKARILANRERMQQQRQLQALKGSTRPRPQRQRFGATLTTYRPPMPAAAGRASQYTPAIGFFIGSEDYSSLTYSFTVYSGNGSASLSKTHRILPQGSHDFALRWGLSSYNNLNYSSAPMDWGAAGSPPSNGMYQGWPYQTIYDNSTGMATGFYGSGSVAYAQGSPEGIQYIYTTARREESRDGNSGVFCLPLSKDTFVLYYFFYQSTLQTYSGNKVERKDKIQPIGQVNIGDYFYGYTGTGTIYAAQRTEQLADSFVDVHQDEERVEHCFLVGRASVKEIPVPPELTAAVGTLYPQLTSPIEVPRKQFANMGELRSTVVSVGTPPELIATSTTVVPLSLEGNDSFAYADLLDPVQGDLYPEVDFQPLAGYGLGRLSRSSHFRWSDYFFTPGIYSVLANGEAIRLHQVDYSSPPYYDDKFSSYDFLYSNFLDETPFKGIYLDLWQEGYPSLRGIPAVQGPDAQPVDIFTAVPSTLFKRNLRSSYTLMTAAAPLYAWDWGAPGYCRERLLALGFSAADLSFSASPTP